MEGRGGGGGGGGEVEGRELLSGTNRLESLLVSRTVRSKTPFWASKTPAAAVSPVIKMSLCLLPPPILITNIYKQLNYTDRVFFSLPGKGVGVSGYKRSCWRR